MGIDALEKIKCYVATLTDKDIIYCQDETYKRFLVFAFDKYYPDEGHMDIEGQFDDIQHALLKCIELNDIYVGLFDRQMGQEVDVQKMLGGE